LALPTTSRINISKSGCRTLCAFQRVRLSFELPGYQDSHAETALRRFRLFTIPQNKKRPRPRATFSESILNRFLPVTSRLAMSVARS
jgi:hypothetical protein